MSEYDIQRQHNSICSEMLEISVFIVFCLYRGFAIQHKIARYYERHTELINETVLLVIQIAIEE